MSALFWLARAWQLYRAGPQPEPILDDGTPRLSWVDGRWRVEDRSSFRPITPREAWVR